MNRRTWLLQAGAAAFASPAFAVDPKSEPSKKKGCAGGDPATIGKVGAHWYYTWWTGGKNSTAAEFVPMIKGGKEMQGESAFDQVRQLSGVTHLLGYNEPERSDQGNLAMADALANWPRLMKLAEEKKLRLGSPAPSSDDKGMNYFHEFMGQVKARTLHMDFIAVHWYRSRDAKAFIEFVENLGKRYRLPVWVTEFNGWNGDEPDNFKFLKEALRGLERSRHVERYAYFEPGKGKPLSLFKEDGSLSRMGEAYRDAGA